MVFQEIFLLSLFEHSIFDRCNSENLVPGLAFFASEKVTRTGCLMELGSNWLSTGVPDLF